MIIAGGDVGIFARGGIMLKPGGIIGNITHRFDGIEGIETALVLMKDKPKDPIKPTIIIK